MNKIICSLLTIVIALCFASCEKAILNNGKEVGKSKSKFKTISLRINEEITTSEAPLFSMYGTRGTKKKLYGINVYQKRAKSNSYSKYAYGLFDDPSKISIVLNENCLYRFECLIVEEGEDGVYLSADGYMEPFVTRNLRWAPIHLQSQVRFVLLFHHKGKQPLQEINKCGTLN